MNSSNNRTDAFVKLYLLPRRTMTKKKTKLIKNCLNPEWNEDFEFKSVTPEDLQTRKVLECSVWDYDIRGCNDFIGCTRVGPDPEKCEKNGEVKEEWMDSFGEEVELWEAMLARPEEWVERELSLRPSIEMLEIGGKPRQYQVDLVSAPADAESAAEGTGLESSGTPLSDIEQSDEEEEEVSEDCVHNVHMCAYLCVHNNVRTCVCVHICR